MATTEIGYWVTIAALVLLLVIFVRDGLTSLWVRRVYDIAYRYVIKTRSHQIVLMDVNGFKLINDNRGHPAGDSILKQIGLIILGETRLRGFRFGGDEFAILLPWTTRERAEAIVERICQRVSDTLGVTLSVGVGQNEEEADKALYRVKAASKDRIEISMGSG